MLESPALKACAPTARLYSLLSVLKRQKKSMNKQLHGKKNSIKPKEIKYLFTIKRIDGLLNEQRLKEKIEIILRFVHQFIATGRHD